MEEVSNLPARFFKVVLPSTTTRQRLRIPNKFVEKYGNELSSLVTLTDPSDGNWCVRLEKAEKTLWLHDGWEKFIDDHSIDYGYFLLFKYTGNSSFKVHIFDLSTTEVDYHKNRNFKKDENSDDDSVKILTSFPSKPEISSSRHGVGNICGIHATYDIRHGVDRGNRDAAETSKSRSSYLTRSKCKIEGGGLGIKTENLNTSTKFSPKNPSFVVDLKPNNLFPRCWMDLPGASEHFELHDSDGKKWLLNIIRGKRRQNYLGKGWKTVVKEKSLKVGDTCVFELIDVNKCMLKVFTFGNMGKIPDGVQRALIKQ
ncbi:B3 domain-containing transcription factor VRN1-like [Olea europaea subsp. europaea]|uniref:B3 domain-containing transcription factor VRN1-like n=1 Tax=Olea europaea subsp. europaea TaxID=158383 RepID=A0A8S0QXS8_OLEEU|nr:B3 domain-containing transcription factor VRN1-like [Olea europaea subsp. europaea]